MERRLEELYMDLIGRDVTEQPLGETALAIELLQKTGCPVVLEVNNGKARIMEIKK